MIYHQVVCIVPVICITHRDTKIFFHCWRYQPIFDTCVVATNTSVHIHHEEDAKKMFANMIP